MTRRRKRHQAIQWFMIFVIALNVAGLSHASAAQKARNVILLIADGCSSEQYTFARWYKGAPLSFDSIQAGGVKTHIADSVVADSAPAATAYATGIRSSDKFISVGPREMTLSCIPTPETELQYRPLATLLEGARLQKKATGLVATSRISHATPAAFMSHSSSRNLEQDIMEQAVFQDLDVVFGGGKEYLLPKELGGKRSDGENLLEVLKNQGYQIVDTREEMARLNRGKAYGLFAASHMSPEIDRVRNHPLQPTLREMTEKAIGLLSRNPRGFFLMVEGSQIDWACHANDPAHLLGDMLAYDAAADAALDFARKDGHTLVIALSDHNTGGFSIGNNARGGASTQMKIETFLSPFRKMNASSAALWEKIRDKKTPENMIEVVKEGWGMDITTDDASAILTLSEEYKHFPFSALGEILCAKYTFAGWTTHGHCGGDVPLFAFGPGKPSGLLDAPEIAKAIAVGTGLNLDRLNRRLFAEAQKEFDSVTLDRSLPENPVAIITYKGKTAKLPINKNLLEINGKGYFLEGVVVYAPNTGKVYIPLQAVQLIRGAPKKLPSVSLMSSSSN